MEEKKSFFKENGIYIVLVIIVLLIKIFVVSPIRVNGASMNNTLYDKDIMILDEISYRFNDIKRFDIVVVETPDEYLIKRVVGLPGETIKYEDNILYINGKEVKENFTHKETKDFEAKVPEGKYFVLGDNRTNSSDSRIIGAVSKKQIKGKTSLIIFPFSRAGIVK
ncbi:MAG: signal peptidase I [Bacilli bacterium]|nr:signal peptidase I [Bacilli bacterium]